VDLGDKQSDNSSSWIKLVAKLARRPHKHKSKDGACCTCPRLYFLPIECNCSVEFLIQSQSVSQSVCLSQCLILILILIHTHPHTHTYTHTYTHTHTYTMNKHRTSKGTGFTTDLSHTRTVQAAMIHREMLKTSSTVPGQMVMRVFITNRVLKCTCKTHTRTHTQYSRADK